MTIYAIQPAAEAAFTQHDRHPFRFMQQAARMCEVAAKVQYRYQCNRHHFCTGHPTTWMILVMPAHQKVVTEAVNC
jgi:hypothetical protein